MRVVYLILLALAAVCFGLAMANVPAKVNLLAAGLLAWVLVPLIQHADRLD